ncbi:cohesin subunit SA-3 isoform X2 [Osmerus eperlanus]|uniref:cohesin subunit SA-3 isoform X2 n=1 Tax=Osmerus eperlanus TaxID=29151 RepID=UPI002E0EF5F8
MAQSDESSQASSEETFDMSDSDSDFEVEFRSTKERKRNVTNAHGPVPPKRPRRKAASQPSSRSGPGLSPTPPASSPQLPSHGTPRPVSPKPLSPRQERRGNKDRQFICAGDMYEAIRSGKSAVVTVVDEWLDGYKHDREAGLLVLINFVVQCCGCKGVVSREMFDSMQNAEIISTLTKEFNEESVNYPLCTPGPQWKRFKAGLCEFFRVLVRSCQNSLLYDDYLFSSLLALLTGLSDSQVRAFRHTSTLVAMKLMTALVEVAVTVFAQVKTTQRRYDVETTRSPEDRALGRLEELQANVSQLLEHQEELSSMMNAVFRGVFVHRYRDLVPEVRAACITEMGEWLKENPTVFLNDGYLKYMGWTLHDKQGLVRLQCVRALQGLYQEKDFIGRLELFTSRFKERMLSMVLDREPDVAVEAVQLLLLIQQRTEEGLSEEESSSVYPLVFAAHRGLASTAGAFLYHKLCSVMARDNEDQDMGARRAAFLNILVSFYTQSEFHEHGAYLVDSLWAVAASELRDWETMTSLLLLQETEPGQGPSDEEEGALIELMMCAMRQAAEVHPPVGRAQGKKVLSMKDKKTQAQDRRRITAHFIPLLPQLLAKYSADVEKVTSLLKAPLYFDLETYSSTSRLEKCLDVLLVQVWAVVEKHTDGGVLEACARVACALSSPRYTFSSRADLALSQLLDRLTDRFSSHLNDLLQGTADEDDVYSAANTLKRIAAFSSAKDLTGWKLFEPCFKLLKSGTESTDMDKELMVPALTCAAFHLLWERQKVSCSTPSEVELKQLRKEFRSFCVVCQSCLSVAHAEIRDQSFELLCDLLLLFGLGSVRSQPALHSLALPPCDPLRSEMAAFLLDHVFTEPEDHELAGEEEEAEVRISTLQRRRNQLAGYCKLVIYGVLDLSAATDIFRHYSKFYKDYGDIIKETLCKTRMMSPVQSARTLCLSLQQMFTAEVSEEQGAGDLGEIRDLARRLAMSFGIDLQRVRSPLLALHTDGIRFAFREAEDGDPPPNLAFLEILSEFSFKLLRQDRAQILVFLKGECGSAAPSCQAVKMYHRSLQPGPSRSAEAPSPHSTPVAKRRRPSPPGTVSSVSEEAWLDSSGVRGNLSGPTLTSTLERQPAAHASYAPSIVSEAESDDFSEGSMMRRVEPNRRAQPSPSELDSHLTLLTLIEEDEQEVDIDEFESNDSDSGTAITLPSTRRSTSYLEDLF